MRRTFLAAGLSIAVLLGASVAIILALTRPSPAPQTPEPSAPALAAEPAPPGPPAAAPFKGGKLLPAAGRDPGPGTERRGETWAPMADRVARKAVRKALRAASVQSRLSRCTAAGGFGGTAAPAGAPEMAPASLVLEIEARGGGLRVVDATVREWGGASEAMVACARTVLRSQVIPAPKARLSDGKRMRMLFHLSPRGDAVASR